MLRFPSFIALFAPYQLWICQGDHEASKYYVQEEKQQEHKSSFLDWFKKDDHKVKLFGILACNPLDWIYIPFLPVLQQ